MKSCWYGPKNIVSIIGNLNGEESTWGEFLAVEIGGRDMKENAEAHAGDLNGLDPVVVVVVFKVSSHWDVDEEAETYSSHRYQLQEGIWVVFLPALPREDLVQDSAEQGNCDEKDAAQVEIAFDEGVVEQGGQQQDEVPEGHRVVGVLGLFVPLAVRQVLHFVGDHK